MIFKLTVLVVFADHIAQLLVGRIESQSAHNCPQFLFANSIVAVLVEQIKRCSKFCT